MSHWDVFNGDADGLCALQQLRLARPRESRLVTGLKREIALLLPIALVVLWMGVYPKPFTDVMHQSVTQLITHVGQSKL